jgi:hypothetical protein
MTHAEKLTRLDAARRELAAAEAALDGPHVDALVRFLLSAYSADETRRLARHRLHAAASDLPGPTASPHEVAVATARLFATEGVPAGTLHEWLVVERPRRAGEIAAALALWPTFDHTQRAPVAPTPAA